MIKDDLQIIRAAWKDREELLDEVERAFEYKTDFRNQYSYLFQENRIGDHYICKVDGKIAGAVGFYPYQVNINGTVFNTAGLGQVFCQSDYRGKGVMSSILDCITSDPGMTDYDFTWLFGDRRRYANFGWATGGIRKIMTFDRKYLPENINCSSIRYLTSGKDLLIAYNILIKHQDITIIPFEDFKMVMNTPSAGGLILGESIVLWRKNHNRIIFSAGDSEEIANLLAFKLQENKMIGMGDEIFLECSAFKSSGATVGLQHSNNLQIINAANFRVGGLKSLFSKISMNQIGGISGKDITIRNSDTNETILIGSNNGRIKISEVECKPDIILDTYGLSELVFGNFPLDSIVSGIPEDSVLRYLLPFNSYISKLVPV